jgi:CO/xanthine dehydrogenase FAD-binding subunit
MEKKDRSIIMIPFDFEYYRPDTLNEAIDIFNNISSSNKTPVYYGGGTEIISMARAGSIHFDAVIDIKNINECKILGIENNNLIIGSAITLTQIAESGYFPLLSEIVSRIADHTIQDKITIGGNLASTIIYREASLPLKLTNCRVKVLNNNGINEVQFSDVFDGRLHLQKVNF